MKKIKTYFILTFLLISNIVSSQTILVSESSRFSLLTCSPGPVAYQYFGHTALRFNDPVTGIDLVFNYGIFDFDQKGFYYKFVKGDTYYMLGVYDTDSFKRSYEEDNTQVLEQELNLTQEQRQVLLDRLLKNYEPQNRYYLYNFAYDNCATRPNDKIKELLTEDNIIFNYQIPEKSFRDWVAVYTGENTWLKFGIDLLFGKESDKKASRDVALFAPDILSKDYANAQIIVNDSTTIPLVKNEVVFLASERKNNITPAWYLQPLFYTILLLIAGICLTYYETKKKKKYRYFDGVLYFIMGLVGIIIFYLMFFSIHPMVGENYNLLWTNPLNLLVGIFIVFPKMDRITRWFQVLNLFLFSLALVFMVIGVQGFNIAFYPIVFLLLIRTIHWLIRKA